jgi:hypothetical protein
VGRERVLFASELDMHLGRLEARRVPGIPPGDARRGGHAADARRVRLPGHRDLLQRAAQPGGARFCTGDRQLTQFTGAPRADDSRRPPGPAVSVAAARDASSYGTAELCSDLGGAPVPRPSHACRQPRRRRPHPGEAGVGLVVADTALHARRDAISGGWSAIASDRSASGPGSYHAGMASARHLPRWNSPPGGRPAPGRPPAGSSRHAVAA